MQAARAHQRCMFTAQHLSVNEAMALLLQEGAFKTSPDLQDHIGMWGAPIGVDGERFVRTLPPAVSMAAMACYLRVVRCVQNILSASFHDTSHMKYYSSLVPGMRSWLWQCLEPLAHREPKPIQLAVEAQATLVSNIWAGSPDTGADSLCAL